MRLIGALLLLALTGCFFKNYNVELKEGLPKFGSFGGAEEIYGPLIRLTTPKGRGFCSATVIDNNYALTAGHCIVDEDDRMTKDDIHIYDEVAGKTGIVAKAVAVNKREDYGLLKADFTKFNKVKILDNNAFLSYANNPMVLFAACGFPHGGTASLCTVATNPRMDYFSVMATGQLYPGMSGGPLLMLTPFSPPMLVGINIAVAGAAVFFVPYVHLLESFDLVEAP